MSVRLARPCSLDRQHGKEGASVVKSNGSGPLEGRQLNLHASSDHPETLGIPAHRTIPDQQKDAIAELTNKIAWAIGSTYRATYSTSRSPARRAAWELVKALILTEGYPRGIELP